MTTPLSIQSRLLHTVLFLVGLVMIIIGVTFITVKISPPNLQIGDVYLTKSDNPFRNISYTENIIAISNDYVLSYVTWLPTPNRSNLESDLIYSFRGKTLIKRITNEN